MNPWQWDPSLFAGAAQYYERGRLPYAPTVADVLASALALDGRGRLLDAGCGPGRIALRLASKFEEVVGLDPDAGMIAEAQRSAAEQGITNAHWVQARAEELPAGLGMFRAVTFAASFHWMDRPRVARATRAILEPAGAAVQVDAPGYRFDDLQAAHKGFELPYPLPPEAAIDALRVRWLGPDRRAGQGVRKGSLSGEDEVFQAAGFRPARIVTVLDGRVLIRSIDDLVAERLSNSSTAPHLFGARLDEFVAELCSVLTAASPAGLFSVRLPDNILHVWVAR